MFGIRALDDQKRSMTQAVKNDTFQTENAAIKAGGYEGFLPYRTDNT
jgi:hypothetical protein